MSALKQSVAPATRMASPGAASQAVIASMTVAGWEVAGGGATMASSARAATIMDRERRLDGRVLMPGRPIANAGIPMAEGLTRR